VAPLAHGAESAAGLDRAEEAVDQTKLALDDKGDDVVGEASGVRSQMRTDDS
jgi:hypothetical protein